MGAVVGGGFQIPVAGKVEGLEDLLILRSGAVADDLLDLIDFEIEGPRAVGNQESIGPRVAGVRGIGVAEPLPRAADALKLAVFTGLLAFCGILARRGLLPRTRPIVPGELAISD